MSRKLTYRGIVLALFASGLASSLAACTPPLPPDVLAAKAESAISCLSGAADVSLPAEFTGAMTAVSGSLAGACPDQSIAEVAPGETVGIAVLDHAPSAEEMQAFGKTCPSPVIVVPTFAYPVVATFNIIGLEGLVLSPDAIAGILNGTVSSWADPSIVQANLDYDMTGLPPITVMSVDTPSGSVEAMTAWLSKTAPSAWTAGPVGTLESGQKYPTVADLIADLTVTDGAFAVLPSLVALSNGLPMASLPVAGPDGTTVDVGPDDGQLLKVGSGATTITKDEAGNLFAGPAIGGVPVEGNFDAAAAKVVLAEGQPLIGYPVLGYAHAMVCDDPADPLPLSTAQYLQRLAGQGSLETFGLTPLPEPIRIRTFQPLKVQVNLGEDAASSTPQTPSGSPS